MKYALNVIIRAHHTIPILGVVCDLDITYCIYRKKGNGICSYRNELILY